MGGRDAGVSPYHMSIAVYVQPVATADDWPEDCAEGDDEFYPTEEDEGADA